MMSTLAAGFALFAACALSPEAAGAPLAPFRAHYAVTRNGSALGDADVRLESGAGGVWTFVTVTRGTGGLAGMVGAEITERSVFRWRDGLPELIDSSYDQSVAWKRKQRRMHVDAERELIESRDDKGMAELPFSPNVLDGHITVLALAVDRARGRKEFTYTVANRRKVEQSRFRDAGREPVETPAGTYQAARIERIREKNPERTTTSWLAPELGYLPVKLVQHEPGGDTVEMRLVRIDR